MRILLDEQLPRQLAPYLVGHDVRTVQQESWAGLTNGELLAQANAAGFSVFVTGDQNLAFQQNISKRRLGVVVLRAGSNAPEDCNARRAAPLLLVVLHAERASLCGPAGDDQPAYLGFDRGQVED